MIVIRNHLNQDLAHLNPLVERNSAGGVTIGIDVPDDDAATDSEAGVHALKVLNDTLIPDDDAAVLDVALDVSVQEDPKAAGELGTAPAKEDPNVIDAEEVPLDGEADTLT